MTVSAIICVLNEEKTIKSVVKKLLASSLITEVICVIDDGSEDSSFGILKSFGKSIKLLHIGKNRGKGNAMAKGVEVAKGQIIAFFDADIINLSQREIKALIIPALEGQRVVLGYPGTRHFLAKLFLPLTGERVYYKKDLFPHLNEMAKKGYGVETYLNEAFKENDILVVPILRLKLLEKREKQGFYKSLKHEAKATVQISKEVALREDLIPSKRLTYATASAVSLLAVISFSLAQVSPKSILEAQAQLNSKIVVIRSDITNLSQKLILQNQLLP